ncbi:MAG: alcohol dehydrogenase catalytic domain-containing protein [Acidimicrobiia bacterium]
MTRGHERAGTITALGPGVDGWRVGQAVAVCSVTGCGACVECRNVHFTLCRGALSASGLQRDGAWPRPWSSRCRSSSTPRASIGPPRRR